MTVLGQGGHGGCATAHAPSCNTPAPLLRASLPCHPARPLSSHTLLPHPIFPFIVPCPVQVSKLEAAGVAFTRSKSGRPAIFFRDPGGAWQA